MWHRHLSYLLKLLLAFPMIFPLNVLSSEIAPVSKTKKERYVYFSVGQSENDTYNGDLYNIDTKDTSVSLGLGVQVGSIVFIDFRFASLGDYENSSGSYTESYSALSANLLARLPLGDSGVNLYGSVGYGLLSWEYEVSSLIRVTDSGDTLIAGAGIQYKIPGLENYVLSLGYDQYYFRTSSIYGTGGSHSNTISVLGVGLQYRMQ
jgi:hypothetical protein